MQRREVRPVAATGQTLKQLSGLPRAAAAVAEVLMGTSATQLTPLAVRMVDRGAVTATSAILAYRGLAFRAKEMQAVEVSASEEVPVWVRAVAVVPVQSAAMEQTPVALALVAQAAIPTRRGIQPPPPV